ncbi:MAG TPA: GNVR domain-containing protein [Bryobacteraceae bacterium]|nr:GNVR domain-containing protein [Bryobacteraceae bacterium]
MQPTPESYNVQRRSMDVEDYVDVVRRHRGWIAGPAFAGLVIAVVVAFLWPDTYVSMAVIRVVPPQVPEKYVASNVNIEMTQRFSAMAQSITSRARLTDMVNAHGLYPGLRSRVPMEDVLERMSKDIKINPVFSLRDEGMQGRPASSAYRIEFAYENRYLAQKVVQELVSRFIDESITTRASQSVMTTDFLNDKLAEAKRQLDEIENRLTEFKMRNMGRLPEQRDSNLQQLRTLETQLSAMSSSINRATQEKLLLESQLRTLRDQQQRVPTTPGNTAETAAKSERLMQTEKQILDLETMLSGLRQQYRDTHPDVRRVQAQLAVLKKNRDALLDEEVKREAAVPKTKETAPIRTREGAELEAAIQRQQSFIRAKDMEIEQYVKDQGRLDKAIRSFQDRVEAIPMGEREYAELTRDYALARNRYEELSQKRANSEIATDLESRKQGETLELLDPATLPQTPTEPKRWLIIAIGTWLGLVAGLFLAGMREIRDTSLKNLKDVRAYTGLTVLGSVPLLENDLVVRRKRRLTWLAWSSACIVGFLVMITSVYYYYTKQA